LNQEKLNAVIFKYANSPDLKVDFEVKPGFIAQQIKSYVAVGLILEKRLPGVILLDVQRKYYPFEQAFYNYQRELQLPIIYCGY
jgi:hypothetical protein